MRANLISYRTSRRCLRFLRNKEGITSIEFAFVVPIMLLLVMGIIEFSMIMFVSIAMESATATTSRLGKTGYVTEGKSREQEIIDSIKLHTAGLLDPNKIVITTTIYPAFKDVGKAEPYTDSNGNGMYNVGEAYTDVNGNGQWDDDMGEAGAGDPGDIVLYNVSYPWHINTPIVQSVVGSTFNITVRAVVKNEPFDTGV